MESLSFIMFQFCLGDGLQQSQSGLTYGHFGMVWAQLENQIQPAKGRG